jgi:hypothetical protein
MRDMKTILSDHMSEQEIADLEADLKEIANEKKSAADKESDEDFKRRFESGFHGGYPDVAWEDDPEEMGG